jgi:hypothetical protein
MLILEGALPFCLAARSGGFLSATGRATPSGFLPRKKTSWKPLWTDEAAATGAAGENSVLATARAPGNLS